MRPQKPNAKFIVLCSHAGQKEERVTARTLGMADIFKRPVQADTLAAAVRAVLAP